MEAWLKFYDEAIRSGDLERDWRAYEAGVGSLETVVYEGMAVEEEREQDEMDMLLALSASSMIQRLNSSSIHFRNDKKEYTSRQ